MMICVEKDGMSEMLARDEIDLTQSRAHLQQHSSFSEIEIVGLGKGENRRQQRIQKMKSDSNASGNKSLLSPFGSGA
jgi:hypothetical protein